MKDEIKEILDNVKKCCNITKDQSFTVYQRQDILALLDYITNLQEENRQTKLLKERYQLEKEDYKSRNEKAIKCIKDKYYKEEYERKGTFANKLMNILKGSDK